MSVFTATDRNRITTWLASLATTVQTRQTAYHDGLETVRPASVPPITGETVRAVTRGRGRFFQGIRTPALIPSDGATAPPDLTLKPTDQPESWADAKIALDAQVEVALQCDVYDGPLGRGYVLSAIVEYNGRRWQRALNSGPESWRTHLWRDVSPAVLL